jgi:hypothetical protein
VGKNNVYVAIAPSPRRDDDPANMPSTPTRSARSSNARLIRDLKAKCAGLRQRSKAGFCETNSAKANKFYDLHSPEGGLKADSRAPKRDRSTICQ